MGDHGGAMDNCAQWQHQLGKGMTVLAVESNTRPVLRQRIETDVMCHVSSWAMEGFDYARHAELGEVTGPIRTGLGKMQKMMLDEESVSL